jgi:septal ring factor EnvC (AmiA/AmiB activator)
MRRFVFLLLLLGLSLEYVFGQSSVENIRKQREKTLKEIEYANKILEETKGKTKQSMQEINVINQKLKKRKEYIVTLEAEEAILNQSIQKCVGNIKDLDLDIQKLKSGYAEIIRQFYKSRGKSYYIMYFLAAENMNQLYRRFRFARIYLNYISILRLNMEKQRVELDFRRRELEDLMTEKNSLVLKTRNEYAVIKSDSEQKKVKLDQLKKQQGEIEKEIREKERVARKLENEMTRIIENERKKAGAGTMRSNLTPLELIISNDFSKNQGKLPWPTQRGIISGKYGEHDHPDFKSVKIRNDGIYISTERGELVRAVFKGIVSKVFSIPGENYTVIIRHGNYFTLYHNLIDVKVKAGQSVETKEVIGKVFTDAETKETTLYFQVWRETERNDPELWLAQ